MTAVSETMLSRGMPSSVSVEKVDTNPIDFSPMIEATIRSAEHELKVGLTHTHMEKLTKSIHSEVMTTFKLSTITEVEEWSLMM